MLPVEPVLAHLDRDFDQAVERLRDLLRIRSVSTDPAYKDETRQAAQWLADQLTGMGFEASLRDTPGHPMVVAHHPGPADATGPHVLYYGHYDVQPAEPLELWNSPPFEPTIVDAKHGKRVVARGAVDDKGQVMTFIEAFRAWHARPRHAAGAGSPSCSKARRKPAAPTSSRSSKPTARNWRPISAS